MAHFVNVEQESNATFLFFLTCFDMCTYVYGMTKSCMLFEDMKR